MIVLHNPPNIDALCALLIVLHAPKTALYCPLAPIIQLTEPPRRIEYHVVDPDTLILLK